MNELLDRFIPTPDVRERFETTVHAPASVVMDTALKLDMQAVPLVRAIFRLRGVLLGAKDRSPRPPRGLLEEVQDLGWGVLADRPGSVIVFGARCQPWLADVEFHAIEAEAFAGYSQPGHVKIAWTLETREVACGVTRFAHETRAVATGAEARVKFLRYWRWARFGIVAIRMLLLPVVRRAAERQWSVKAGAGPR
ncbi:MAG TPA: hypothetical protein VMN56_22330 [Casimicrobiaceae bacterium]|nr:hypothetical protein [Casimicrobiaceae bacterium]